MPNVKICLLGKFEILVDGQPSLQPLSQSRKAVLLLQYLLLKNGDAVPHKELIDALWSDDASSNPDMALRAIAHRYRNMTAGTPLEGSIQTTRGAYRWNTATDCEIDLNVMQDLLQQAQQQTGATRIATQERILDIYGGKLLPSSLSEPWVERRSVSLHSQYQKALFAVLAYYKQNGGQKRIIELCERAIAIDPFDERLYMELILALEQCGRTEEAEAVARRAEEQGCLHRSSNAQALNDTYRRMQNDQRVMENELDRVARDIEANNNASQQGAFLCEYPVFCQISHVQVRVYERYHLVPFLVMLTVTPAHTGVGAERTAEVMDLLQNILCRTLRQSDVVSRYSETQFVLLLCGMTAGDGATPLERVRAQFYDRPERGDFVLGYSVDLLSDTKHRQA